RRSRSRTGRRRGRHSSGSSGPTIISFSDRAYRTSVATLRGATVTEPDDRPSDLVALHALCARYMAVTSQHVPDRWLEVFTPDVEYSAFGTPYSLERFPALLDAAPRGQFIGNMPVVEFDGDGATGMQHFVFIDQQTHAMRLGWYRDEYVR